MGGTRALAQPNISWHVRVWVEQMALVAMAARQQWMPERSGLCSRATRDRPSWSADTHLPSQNSDPAPYPLAAESDRTRFPCAPSDGIHSDPTIVAARSGRSSAPIAIDPHQLMRMT